VKNKLKSFEVGGADFLTRDLSPDEMVARIINKIKIFSELSPTLEIGNLKYNTQMMKAQINQVSLDLTILEFRILGHILRFYPNFLTRKDLVEKVWSPSIVKLGTVNTHLTNLREKLYLWDHDFKIRDEEILVLKKQS
jgi:DNA-binding response OmpR family regulator